MDQINEMNITELNELLLSLEEDLDEVQMEKTMVLSQTGLHISSKKILQQSEEFNNEIASIELKIKKVQEEIKSRVNN